jgi:hypothetical protein
MATILQSMILDHQNDQVVGTTSSATAMSGIGLIAALLTKLVDEKTCGDTVPDHPHPPPWVGAGTG